MEKKRELREQNEPSRQRSEDDLAMSRLLRDLDAPPRLADNPLVAHCFASSDLEGDNALNRRMVALRVKAVVLAAVASLENADATTSQARGVRPARNRFVLRLAGREARRSIFKTSAFHFADVASGVVRSAVCCP